MCNGLAARAIEDLGCRHGQQTAPGAFTPERPGFNGALALAAMDVDGDGRDDLVVQGTPPGADIGSFKAWQVFTRSSPGTWTALAQIPHGSDFATPSAAVARDIDGDSRPDVVFGGTSFTVESPSTLQWLRGQPGDGFDSEREFELRARTAFRHREMSLLDVNGDGLGDLIVGADLLLGRPFTGTVWPAGARAGSIQSKEAPRAVGRLSAAGRSVRTALAQGMVAILSH